MDVFAEPDHKVGETDHLEVNMDLVEDANNLYGWAMSQFLPTGDFTWTNCRLPSFTSKMTSFSFKLVHDLLPSEERISCIIPNNSSVCKHCSDNSIADTLHVFFLCSLSQELGDWLLRVVREVDATATPDSVLRLEIYGGDALVWLTVAALSYTWEQRVKKKKAITTDFISICQGDLDIIDLTKHQNIAMLAKNYLSL